MFSCSLSFSPYNEEWLVNIDARKKIPSLFLWPPKKKEEKEEKDHNNLLEMYP